MQAWFPDDATLAELDRRLTNYFKPRIPGNIDPRDLVNDVLLALADADVREIREGNIYGYAYGVARNKLADLRRGKYRKPPFEALPSERHLAMAMAQPGPTTAIDRERVAEVVRTEAAAIEPPYGEVVRLRLEGFGPSEIAERTGIHHHTVRSRLARGLGQLRARIVAVLEVDATR